MSESLPVSQIQPPPPGHARASYTTAREAEAQARISQTTETPKFRQALDRLNRILDRDKPLRDDVPRGYYLNIEI